jgi:hypothetical protein
MSRNEALEHHIERRLRVDLEMGTIAPDEDGDYCCIDEEGTVVWVRPSLEMNPASVRVFSQAAHGVKKSAALLTELNAWNNVIPACRVAWDNGIVRVWGDLTVESIEPGELGWLVRHVARTAQRINEVVCAVYGGLNPWLQPENESSGGATT